MHAAFLQETLSLARIREGFCAPNPSVGAVVVRAGEVVARGYHHAPGHPHAEVEALKDVVDLADCTVYVSLEPCCHLKKRTPPCAPMLVERGARKVIYAYADPNPLVAGQGAAYLREHGVDCRQLSTPELDAFYAPYAHWTRTGRPFVTAKLALTLDGKIALSDGRPHAITGETLREKTHLARRASDAILTTARTVLADNPSLNVRLENQAAIAKPVYVLDARAQTPLNAKLFTTASSLTIFVAEENERSAALERAGARIVKAEAIEDRLHLPTVLDVIGRDGRHALWVEAGGRLFQALQSEGLLQRALLYVAPKWLGENGASAFELPAGELFAAARDVAWRGEGREAVCEVRF